MGATCMGAMGATCHFMTLPRLTRVPRSALLHREVVISGTLSVNRDLATLPWLRYHRLAGTQTMHDFTGRTLGNHRVVEMIGAQGMSCALAEGI